MKIFRYSQSFSLPLPLSPFPPLPLPSPCLPSLPIPFPRGPQPLSAARGPGGALKLPQWVRAEPGRQTGFGVLNKERCW